MKFVLSLIAVGLIAVPVLIHAQTAGTGVDRLTATTVNTGAAGEPVRIEVMKWSSDADRTNLLTAFAKGDKDFQTALSAAPTVGYLWTAGTAGYLLKFAVKTAMPDGTERIVMAIERPLAVPNRPLPAGAPDYPFTLIDVRIDAKKVGEAKSSFGGKIVADQQAKLLAIENYAGAPVVLNNVKR